MPEGLENYKPGMSADELLTLVTTDPQFVRRTGLRYGDNYGFWDGTVTELPQSKEAAIALIADLKKRLQENLLEKLKSEQMRSSIFSFASDNVKRLSSLRGDTFIIVAHQVAGFEDVRLTVDNSKLTEVELTVASRSDATYSDIKRQAAKKFGSACIGKSSPSKDCSVSNSCEWVLCKYLLDYEIRQVFCYDGSGGISVTIRDAPKERQWCEDEAKAKPKL